MRYPSELFLRIVRDLSEHIHALGRIEVDMKFIDGTSPMIPTIRWQRMTRSPDYRFQLTIFEPDASSLIVRYEIDGAILSADRFAELLHTTEDIPAEVINILQGFANLEVLVK